MRFRLPVLVCAVVCAGWLGIDPACVSAQSERSVLPSIRMEGAETIEAQRLLVRGLTRAFLDDHAAALGFYQEALRLTPDAPTILAAAAEAQDALGNTSAALFYAEQARQHGSNNPAYFFQVAQIQARTGDLAAAAEAYRLLLDHFPGDPQALQALAQTQSLLGRQREAVATYEQLLNQAGADVGLHRQVLEIYLRLNDTAAAARTLEAITHLDPTDAAAWRMLGDIYRHREEFPDAINAYESAYDLDAADTETILALTELYRTLGHDAQADALIDTSTRPDDATAPELIARAEPLALRAETDANAAEAAVRLLEEALALSPDNPRALDLLGRLTLRAGRPAEAAPLLDRALQLDPRNPEGWRLAAEAYLAAGQPDRAVDIAEESLLLFPGQLPLLRILAESLSAVGRFDEAVTRFEEALALLKEDHPEAVEQFAEVYAALGAVHVRRQDYAAADAAFEQALRNNPDEPNALNDYAASLAARGERLGDARDFARHAVRLAPGDATYRSTLGWTLLLLGETAEGEKLLLEAVEAAPDDARVYEHAGDLFARQGDFETARRYWREALTRDPSNDILLQKLERQQN